jgi:hypothetical protein
MPNGRRFQRHPCAGGCGGSRAKVVRCIRGDRLRLTGAVEAAGVEAVAPPQMARVPAPPGPVVGPPLVSPLDATLRWSRAGCSVGAEAVLLLRHRNRSSPAAMRMVLASKGDLRNRTAGQRMRPINRLEAIFASQT